MQCMDDDMRVMKALALHLQESSVCSFIQAKCYDMVNDAIFTSHLKLNDTDLFTTSAMSFLTSKPPECVSLGHNFAVWPCSK